MVGSFHSRKFTAFRFRKISTQWELKFWSHSDTSFYAKVDKDLTFINQNIVKNTANDLRAKQEFPTTAKNLTITTPRTSCIYFLPKIHKPNNPGRPHRLCLQLSHRIYFQLFRQIMASIVKNSPSYIKDSQHLQFSVNLISLAKTNLLSQWILRLFILSLP